jgi:hypothetical protein
MRIALLLLACDQTPAAPPFVDQPAWLDQLRVHRPDVLVSGRGGVLDPAWQALVLRPRYRADFLVFADTYASFRARTYTQAQREIDARWAQSLRDAQQAFVPTTNIVVAGYDRQAYVGYQVGPRSWGEPDGLVVNHKAFLELSDFERSLTPERYAGFVAKLGEHGFIGDSKVDLRPGQVRFQYNNVIVHAPSAQMARCAEAVGIAYFGAELEHVARGIDAVVDHDTLDWHSFLLTGRYAELPSPVRDFVEYRIPVGSTAVCPAGGPT